MDLLTNINIETCHDCDVLADVHTSMAQLSCVPAAAPDRYYIRY
jgi:hypothetical protein